MKNKIREEARGLFVQSGLTKTEIAEKFQVSRRTITLWAHQDKWDNLRMSARSMPSLVAEKCYHLLHQYTSHILGDYYSAANMNIHQAQIIHLLASSVKKIRNRSTVNESMEMFNFFLGSLQRKDPNLAAQVAPEMEEYINNRVDISANDFLTSDFADDASIPFPDMEIQEGWADDKDAAIINQEFATFLEQRAATAPPITAQDTPEEEPPASSPLVADSTPEPPLSVDDSTAESRPPEGDENIPAKEDVTLPPAAADFLQQAAERSEALKRQANEIMAKWEKYKANPDASQTAGLVQPEE